MPPQITCVSALPGKMGKHENCSLKGCISALSEPSHCLISSVFLTHDLYSRCCMTT